MGPMRHQLFLRFHRNAQGPQGLGSEAPMTQQEKSAFYPQVL